MSVDVEVLSQLLLQNARLAEKVGILESGISEIREILIKQTRGKTKQIPEQRWMKLDDVLRLDSIRGIGITHRRHLVNSGIHCGILREGIEYRRAANGGRGGLGYQFEIKALEDRINWFHGLPVHERVERFGVDTFKCYPGKQS